MLKVATLVVEQPGNVFANASLANVEPVLAAARNLRDSGACVVGDIAIQAQPGARGYVFSSAREFSTIMRFRVNGEVEAAGGEPEAEAPAPAANLKPRGRRG